MITFRTPVDVLLLLLIIYGAMLGPWTLVSWIVKQTEKRKDADRARKGLGWQSPIPASNTQTAWGCLAICLIPIIMVILSRVGRGDSPRQANAPVQNATQIPAVASPAATAPPSLTLESLQRWYATLAARRRGLAGGDNATLRSFNEEAALYTAATAAYLAQQSVGSASVASSAPAFHYDNVPEAPSLSTSSEHYVNSYVRKDGTSVAGHYQTNPDSTTLNNYSSQGNINPHTGRVGTVSSGSSTGPSHR